MMLIVIFVVLSNFVASELTGIIKNVVKVELDVPVSTNELKDTISVLNEPSMDFIAMAKKDGYLVEEHTVTTEDGYILTAHRIRCKIGDKKRKTGPPVLAVHGLFLNSVMWIIAGENAIGYLLVQAGYDLWFANLRGTIYSLKHVKYTPNEKTYWKFSFEEIGKYDIPAFIDYILKITERDCLSYIGFSLGTTVYFSMQRPCSYDQIRVAVLLAPVAFMTNSKSPFVRFATSQLALLKTTFGLVGTYKLGGNASATNQMAKVLCSTLTLSTDLCRSFLEVIMGFDPEQMEDQLVQRIYKHFPDSSSLMNFEHFGQLVHINDFQKYDHGVECNKKKYGSPTPKKYDFSLVTSPTYLFAGKNDLLSDILDVNRIEKRLPNVMEKYVVPWKYWNHYDHIWAIQANELVGKKIIKILSKHTGNEC